MVPELRTPSGRGISSHFQKYSNGQNSVNKKEPQQDIVSYLSLAVIKQTILSGVVRRESCVGWEVTPEDFSVVSMDLPLPLPAVWP